MAVERKSIEASTERASRAKSAAVEPAVSGTISYSSDRCTASCRVLDVSGLGCRLEFDPDDWMNPVAHSRTLPGSFRLMVPVLGFEADCVVSSRGKHHLAVRFAGRARALPPAFRKKRRFKGF